MPVLKNAFIFSAMSGLRWSDIEKLVWSEVQHSSSSGITSVSGRKKQKEQKHCPYQNKPFRLLGERRKQDDKVFEGLYYSPIVKLREWVIKAGIHQAHHFSLCKAHLRHFTNYIGNRYLHSFKTLRSQAFKNNRNLR